MGFERFKPARAKHGIHVVARCYRNGVRFHKRPHIRSPAGELDIRHLERYEDVVCRLSTESCCRLSAPGSHGKFGTYGRAVSFDDTPSGPGVARILLGPEPGREFLPWN